MIPLLVRGFERLGDLPGDGQGLVERDRTFGDAVLERWAFDQFEDECPRVLGLFQPVDGGNVRMVQGGEDFGFSLEAGRGVLGPWQRRRAAP